MLGSGVAFHYTGSIWARVNLMRCLSPQLCHRRSFNNKSFISGNKPTDLITDKWVWIRLRFDLGLFCLVWAPCDITALQKKTRIQSSTIFIVPHNKLSSSKDMVDRWTLTSYIQLNPFTLLVKKLQPYPVRCTERISSAGKCSSTAVVLQCRFILQKKQRLGIFYEIFSKNMSLQYLSMFWEDLCFNGALQLNNNLSKYRYYPKIPLMLQ